MEGVAGRSLAKILGVTILGALLIEVLALLNSSFIARDFAHLVFHYSLWWQRVLTKGITGSKLQDDLPACLSVPQRAQVIDMITGLEVSGAFKATQAVFWLYQICTDPSRSASRQSREFADCIQGLDAAVQHLRRSIPRRRLRRDQHTGKPHDPRNAYESLQKAENTLAALLEECESLLRDKAQFRRNSSNVIQDIIWAAGTGDEVSRLRARVHEQINKVHFMHNIFAQDTNRALLSRSQRPRLRVPSEEEVPLSRSLALKFEEACAQLPPPSYVSAMDFDISDGCDALDLLLHESTCQALPDSSPTMYQYLNLQKALWLLRQIQRLPMYRAMRPYDRDWQDVEDFEDILARELCRSDLVRWSPSELLRLPRSHFLIWSPDPVGQHLDRMVPQEGEEPALDTTPKVPPGCQKAELIAYRKIRDKGGTSMRILQRYTKSADLLIQPEEMTLDLLKSYVVPLYIVAESRIHGYSIKIGGEHDAGRVFRFDSLRDVMQMQRTVTSFRVVSDFLNVDWILWRPKVISSKHINCKSHENRVQILLWDPKDVYAETLRELVQSLPNDTASDVRSVASHMSTASAASVALATRPSNVEDPLRSRGPSHSTEGVQITLPYAPLLVVYCVEGKTKVYIGVELNARMEIDHTACECKGAPNVCKRTVIGSKSSFIAHCAHAPTDSSESLPNLGIFARPYLPGQNSCSPLVDRSEVKSVECHALGIDFRDVGQRKAFNKQLRVILDLRKQTEAQPDSLIKHARFESNRPARHASINHARPSPKDRIMSVGPSTLSPSMSVASLPPFSSSQPELHRTPIDRSPSFDGGHARSSSRVGSILSDRSSQSMSMASLESRPPSIAQSPPRHQTSPSEQPQRSQHLSPVQSPRQGLAGLGISQQGFAQRDGDPFGSIGPLVPPQSNTNQHGRRNTNPVFGSVNNYHMRGNIAASIAGSQYGGQGHVPTAQPQHHASAEPPTSSSGPHRQAQYRSPTIAPALTEHPLNDVTSGPLTNGLRRGEAPSQRPASQTYPPAGNVGASYRLRVVNDDDLLPVQAHDRSTNSPEGLSAASWSCRFCTLINEAPASACAVCETSREAPNPVFSNLSISPEAIANGAGAGQRGWEDLQDDEFERWVPGGFHGRHYG